MSGCKVSQLAAPHTKPYQAALLKRIADGHFGGNTRAVVLAGNAEVTADGNIHEGALFCVPNDTPLADAQQRMGSIMSGRIGLYRLKREPEALRTTGQVRTAIIENAIPQSLDDYGEDYGPFTHKTAPGEPWVPKMDNGHASNNFVALGRSVQDPSQFALLVHSNATPQVQAAIKAALSENPAITVGEFVSSPVARAINERSTLQNSRIAERVGCKLGIADALDLREHPTERTSSDEYAAAVRYAHPTSMVTYGDMRAGTNDVVRISNSVLDLDTVSGNAVPLSHGPLNGFTVMSNVESESGGCARARDSKTFASIAAMPRIKSDIKMGADEIEQLQRILHWSGSEDGTSVTQVAARIGAIDESAAAHSATQIKAAGLSHLRGERFKTMGAIVFP